jgi:small redox-active disulfide protein 2
MTAETMLIQILGIGCPRCHQMEKDVERIVARVGLRAKVECVRDEETIMQFGVFVLPALVVDGKVVTAGYRGPQQLAKVIEAL